MIDLKPCNIFIYKYQAFLEMEDEMKAEAMVNYYQYAPAKIRWASFLSYNIPLVKHVVNVDHVSFYIRGSKVYVQYSSHKELKIEKQSPTVSLA